MLISMVLVSRSGLVEEDAVEVFRKISSPFKGNINVVVFPFPYHHAVGQLVDHPPTRIVSHPKDKKLP